ncbi:O-methyltransferase-domain-containing protein [Dactylonectria macrodidyma]|uniref:O-methyltransferase-domain-containing protein n=1 Tax=Dactylonectria macrodidyma TaxID=307937 RepID=A0A9P9FUF1_9HYPO|nr:O-methyltransferase-domain-containing protein [Dactylonectria macrodidyma]
MADKTPSLVSLAKAISESANALAAKLEQEGSPAPSFAEDGLVDYPKHPEILGIRMQLLDAAADMYRLALGPTDTSFLGPLFLNYDATITDILNQFDFWSAVPLGGSATYGEIAKRVNLPENLVRRVLRYAIAIRIFASAPSTPDSVVHTSLSAAPAKQPLLQTWLRHNLEEARPGAVHIPEAFRKFDFGKEKSSEEPLESGFTLANVDRLDKPESFWDYLNRDVEGKPKGWRASKFAESMQAAAASSAIKIEDSLKTGYDWSALGEATVVDIGGSSGHDAIHLVRAFPNLKIVVQDLPEVQAAFNEKVPGELQSRVSFEARDFFSPQNTPGAVYMLKMILHDWPDKYAAKILATLLPHLESGSRLLLFEAVAPPDTAALPFATLGRMMNAADLQMLCAFNSLERSVDDWKALLGKVDKRLEITYVSNLPGSLHNFVEIKLSAS